MIAHESHWWQLYYASWLGFAIWLLRQPRPPEPRPRLNLFLWPVWARVLWGVLTLIALGRFVSHLIS